MSSNSNNNNNSGSDRKKGGPIKSNTKAFIKSAMAKYGKIQVSISLTNFRHREAFVNQINLRRA